MSITLLAGVATGDITPPVGIAHANWGAQTHERATGIDMPLTATALALSDGTTTSLILDVDTMWLWSPLGDDALDAIVELTGIARDSIRLSYSHTHSGALGGDNASWVRGGTETMQRYGRNLASVLAGLAWSAVQGLQPARIATATGQSAISVNRRFHRPEDGAVIVGRNWEGTVDPEVRLFRIDTMDGSPLAAVVGFGCHPITVGPDNDRITPDYPGVVRQVVRDATGATCLFLQGASGDIGPVRGVARDGINQYRRLGAMLGHEAARLWWEAEPAPTEEIYTGTLESGAPLAMYDDRPLPDQPATVRVIQTTIELPIRASGDTAALEAELAACTARLAQLRAENGPAEEITLVTKQAKRASIHARLSARIGAMTAWPVEVYLTTIGDDIALVGLSLEPFASIGLAIRENSPYPHTLVSGYSGLTHAYLPDTADYAHGGYEIEATPFAPEAATVAIAAVTELLRSVRDGRYQL